MDTKFEEVMFKNCDINDSFFDSLREDYDGFDAWFKKKANEKALILKIDEKIVAFIYPKMNEKEEINLTNETLPAIPRLKIGTLKLSTEIKNKRFGEGAIGILLWRWVKSTCEEIYVTVFEKQKKLVCLLEKFGFTARGFKPNGELVLLRSKKNIDFSTPYKSFPFINSKNINKIAYLAIDSKFHDTLFPYSELYGTNQEAEEIAAANGMTKVYIGWPQSLTYEKNDLLFIYRKSDFHKKYKSVITSYCTVLDVIWVKKDNRICISQEEYLKQIGNKSIFSISELMSFYNTRTRNLVIIKLLYNGYFGKGNNVCYATLNDFNLFNGHPYQSNLTLKEGIKIFELAKVDYKEILK